MRRSEPGSPASTSFAWPTYLGGHAVSALGDRVTQVALPALALLLAPGVGTPPALLLSSVAASGLAAQLLFLLLAGHRADTWNARRVMLGADALRLGAAVAVLALLLSGAAPGGQVLGLLLLSAVFGLGSAAFGPASARMMLAVLPASALAAGNAAKGVASALTGLAGPLLGSALVYAGQATGALGVDALTFLFSLLCVLRLGRLRTPGLQDGAGQENAGSPDQGSLLATWRETRAEPWLRQGVALFALLNVLAVYVTLVLVPLLTAGQGGPGPLYAAEAAGGLAMAALLIRRPVRAGLRTGGPGVFLGVALSGLGLLIATVPSAPVRLVGLALFGAGVMLAQLVWNGLLQTEVPASRLGRVTGLDLFGSLGLLPPGLLLAGVTLGRLTPHLGLLLCAVSVLLLALLGLIGARRWRK